MAWAILPTESCSTSYKIDQFTKNFPDYSFKTSLKHSCPVFVSRFIVSNIEEIAGPVGFDRNSEGWIPADEGRIAATEQGAVDNSCLTQP